MSYFCPITFVGPASPTLGIFCLRSGQISLYAYHFALVVTDAKENLLLDRSAKVFKLQTVYFTSRFCVEIEKMVTRGNARLEYKCRVGVSERRIEITSSQLRVADQSIQLPVAHIITLYTGASVSVESGGAVSKFVGTIVFASVEEATYFCLAVRFAKFIVQDSRTYRSEAFPEPRRSVNDGSYSAAGNTMLLSSASDAENVERYDIYDVVVDLNKTLHSLFGQTHSESSILARTREIYQQERIVELPHESPESSKSTVIREYPPEPEFNYIIEGLERYQPLSYVPMRTWSVHDVKSKYHGLFPSKAAECRQEYERYAAKPATLKTAELAESKPAGASKQPKIYTSEAQSSRKRELPEFYTERVKRKKFYSHDELMELFETQADEIEDFDEDRFYKYLSRFYIAIDVDNKPVQLLFKAFVNVLLYRLDDAGDVHQSIVSQITRVRNLGANVLVSIELQQEQQRTSKIEVLLQRYHAENLMRSFKLFCLNSVKAELRSVD